MTSGFSFSDRKETAVGRSRLSKIKVSPISLAAVLLIPAIFLLLGGCKEKAPPVAAAPPEVEVVPVEQKDVPVYEEWVGTANGPANATIRAQVTGYILKQAYQDGSFVKTGDLLFLIDPAPFEAALNQAKAQQGMAEATLEKTRLDVERYKPLAEKDYISKQEYDNAVQANLSAKAQLDGAKAGVEKASLDLNYTRIVSPIDGIAGISNVAVGDLVGPSQGIELTTVSTVNPIRVYVALSEQKFLKAMGKQAAETKKSEGPELELILADGTVFPHKGHIEFADRQVDVRTGTIRVAGQFPNPGNLLRPGIFAKVRVLVGIQKGALLVPQRAVTELQGSYQVAVVGNDGIVHIRSVKTGQRVGQLWVIEDGVKPGEQVIAEGIQKVKEGMKVAAKPVTATKTEAAGPDAKAGHDTPTAPTEEKKGR
jgi:membrane fusion protein, multidrug efflux system